MRIPGAVIIVAVTLSALAGAQSSNPAFEVASIKPNKTGSNRVNIAPQPGGRFTATNVSAMDLIAIAYGTSGAFPRANIVGAPTWLGRDRFDIQAKAVGSPTQEEFALLLRSLLADRFRLTTHLETRERPIYTLVLGRKDRTLGAGLRPSALNCAGAPDSLPVGCEMVSVPGTLKALGTPMRALTRMLTSWVDDHREVRDETGLTGTFDMEMTWTPTRMPTVPPDASPELARALQSADPNGPSLFTALEEQLGLKLIAGKDRADVLVIDHIEPPTPD